MAIICKKCGYKISDSKLVRCPRCYSLLSITPNCKNCKGCSILSNCNKPDKNK